MPLCTSADRRLAPGPIAYSPHTRAVAVSVPAISPRGTLNRDRGRAVVLLRIGTVRSRGMADSCQGVAGWPVGRRELADAACRVIARNGLAGTTLALVAEESGWSIGSIRHYFPNKY